MKSCSQLPFRLQQGSNMLLEVLGGCAEIDSGARTDAYPGDGVGEDQGPPCVVGNEVVEQLIPLLLSALEEGLCNLEQQ